MMMTVSNKFTQWLQAYDGKIKDKEHLLKLIDKLNIDINKQKNTRAYIALVLLQKKKYLTPLHNKELLDSYKDEMRSCKVPSMFVIEYKRTKYSVPPYLMTKTVNH